MSLGGAEAVGRVFTFLFTALVARVAGIEVLGYLSLAISLVAYISIAGDSGLNQDATRRLVAGADAKHVVQESVRVQVGAAVVATLIIVPITILVYGDPVWKYLLVLIPMSFAVAISTPYLLDSRRRIGTLAVSRLVLTLTVAAVGVILLFVGVSGIWLGLAYCAGYWASTFFVLRMSRSPIRHALKPMGMPRLRSRLAVIRTLGVTGILLHVFVSLPVLAAGLVSTSALANIGLVTRVWFLVSAPAAMAGSVLIPLMVEERGRSRTLPLCLLAFLVGLIGALGLSVISSPLMRLLFGEEAVSAAIPLSIFVLALPFMAVAAVLSARLIAVHREFWIAAGYSISAVTFLGIILMPFWIADAMLISTAWVASYAVLMAILGFATLRTRARSFALSRNGKFSKGFEADEESAIGVPHEELGRGK